MMRATIAMAAVCCLLATSCKDDKSADPVRENPDGGNSTPIEGDATLFPARGVNLAITAGPDGNVWFTTNDGGDSVVVRSDAAGEMSRFLLRPAAFSDNAIVTGSDGNLWFTEDLGTQLGSITPDGNITESAVALDFRGITVGPDGDIWLATPRATIGRYWDGTIDSKWGEFDRAGGGLIGGPDGNLWVRGGSGISRITPEGAITKFPIEPNYTPRSRGMAVGSDGNIWFTEFDANLIGRITPEGELTEFEIPTFNAHPWGMTAGAAGTLWFGCVDGLGRVTLDGEITMFEVGVAVRDVALGADGNIWFTADNTIGRFPPP